MKYKIVLLLILLLMIVGCEKKKDDTSTDTVVGKISEDLDYVLTDVYNEYTLSNEDKYTAQILSINLDTVELSNLSMTLKNNIYLSTKGFKYNENNEVINGDIITYKYYESDTYISIIEYNTDYFNETYGTIVNKVYVINKLYGDIYDNNDLLELYDISEEDIYDKVRNSKVEDADYVVMYIKNNGYLLYINDKDELVLLYDYVSDDKELKKELILVD